MQRATAQIGFRIEGIEDTHATLRDLDKNLRRQILGKAIRKGGKIMVSAVRGNLLNRSGATKKSIGARVKNYRHGTVWTAVVGARKGFAMQFRGENVVPYNIIHFQELGTRPHNLSEGAKLRRGGGPKRTRMVRVGPIRSSGNVDIDKILASGRAFVAARRKSRVVRNKRLGIDSARMHPGQKASRPIQRGIAASAGKVNYEIWAELWSGIKSVVKNAN